METIELSRAVGIAALSADFTEMERLNSNSQRLQNHLARLDDQMEELRENRSFIEQELRQNEESIVSTASRIDGALKALYGPPTVTISCDVQGSVSMEELRARRGQIIAAEEPRKRTRQRKETPEPPAPSEKPEEPAPQDIPTICTNKQCLDHDPAQPNGCRVCENVYECGEVVAAPAAAAPAAPATEPESEPVQVVEEVTAEELAELKATAPAFTPLDEPLGECELCMGYGVVEGELYGEPTLVPCNCKAGKVVAGEEPGEDPENKQPQCCQDCNIADPDCADCHLPDMDAASPVELPEEEQKRRSQYCALWRDQCDPALADKCFSGPGCALLCKKDKGVIPPKVQEQPQPAGDATTQQPAQDTTKAKVKDCPHPKALRRKTPEGEVCKVCGQPVGGEQQASMFGDAA